MQEGWTLWMVCGGQLQCSQFPFPSAQCSVLFIRPGCTKLRIRGGFHLGRAQGLEGANSGGRSRRRVGGWPGPAPAPPRPEAPAPAGPSCLTSLAAPELGFQSPGFWP